MKVSKKFSEEKANKKYGVIIKVGLADKANAYPRFIIRWSKERVPLLGR